MGTMYSFGWEMVGDEDIKGCEMVRNLLISEVWGPCKRNMYTYGMLLSVEVLAYNVC